MAILAKEAADALRQAETTAGRSQRLRGYQDASGFLLLWGVIWAVTDIGFYLDSTAGNWLSLTGDFVGLAGSMLLGLWISRHRPGRYSMRGVAGALLVALAIGLYSLGMSVVSPPQDAGQSQAMAGISVGCAYLVLGAVQGLRLAAVGLAMILLTLAGWIFAREAFMPWMAVAGGGGLLLGGLWLRKV